MLRCLVAAVALGTFSSVCLGLNTEYDAAKDPGSAVDAVDAKVYGRLTGDALGQNVRMADLNGDGLDDLVLSSGLANGGSPVRNDCGAVEIWFGAPGFSGIKDAAGTSGTAPDVTIVGVANSQTTNFKGLEVGDVNGDGVQDLILISHYVANSLGDFGSVYVVYGKKSPASFPAFIDLDTSTSGTHADVRIEIRNIHNSQGALAVGDVNGDGADDILVGSSFTAADNPMGAEVCVILGRTAPAALPASMVRNNSDFFIYTSSTASLTLMTGDVNDDGKDDILVSGFGATDGVRRLRVLLGRSTFSTKYSFADAIYGHAFPSSDFSIKAVANADLPGAMNATAVADVNGDGVKDIIIAAPEGDGPGDTRLNSGDAYVVFGRKQPNTFPSLLDLSVSGDTGANVTIYGYAAQGKLGGAGSGITSAKTRGALTTGDVNGDGIADMIFGAPYAQDSAGEVYVVYGRASGSPFPATIDLGTTNTGTFFSIVGADNVTPGRVSDYGSLSCADVNGDGADDLLLGAAGTTSGPAGNRTRAGEAYIVFGRKTPAVFPASLSLGTVGTNGADVTLYGAANEDGLGSFTALAAGDINGDGGLDAVFGAPSANGPTGSVRGDGGQAYLLKGAPPPQAEIEVELVGSQANTPLTSGVGTVLFGEVAPGSSSTQTFLIKNTGDATLENIEVSLDVGDPDAGQFGITQPAENSIAPGAGRTFTATFAPDSAGSRTATLRVESNDLDEGSFEVELTGTAVLSPEIGVRDGTRVLESTDTVAFGEVVRGGFAERVFTIENTGNGALTGLAVSIATAPGSTAWSVTELPQATVAPAGSTSFRLRFTPAGYGPSSVAVQIASNDASENPFVIHCEGNSIADGPRVARPLSEAAAPPSSAVVWSNSLAGTYDGPVRHATTGMVIGQFSRLQLLPAVPRIQPNPMAKGTLLFQGRKVAVEAVISPSGAIAATLIEPLPGTGTLTLNLQVQRRDASEKPVIDGTVQWLGIVARVTAPSSGYSSTSQAPANVRGTYTMAMPAEDSWGETEPGGDGFAVVTVNADGSVKFNGLLGDGTTFSLTSYLSGDGEIPIHFPIVSSGVTRGLLAGSLTLRDLPGVSDFDGVLDWHRTADAKAKTYPAGFRVKVWALGSKYTAPQANTRALAQLPNTSQNAQLTLRRPTDSQELNRWALDWKTDNTFVHYGPDLVAGSGGGSSGFVSGKVVPWWLTQPQGTSYSGICLQKQGVTAGHFLYGTRSGSARIKPGDFPMPGSEAAGVLRRAAEAGTPATPPALAVTNYGTAASGTYQGIIKGDAEISGALENLVVSKDGNFTGTLWFLGEKHPLKGRIFPDGTASITLTRSGQTPILIALQLMAENAQPGEFQLQGTLSANGADFTVRAPRMPVYGNGLARAPTRGVYTLAMLAPDGVDASAEPGGDGYASLSVSQLGVCSGTLRLADGGTVTFANYVTRQGEWPLYRPLYGKTPKGWLAGSLTFRDVPDVSDLDGEWRWVKNSGAEPASFPYPGGFSTTRQVIGSRYYAPVASTRAFEQLADRPLNAWLRLTGPDFSTLAGLNLTTLDRAVTWLESNTVITHGPDRLNKAACVTSTGIFGGTYEDKPRGVSQFIGGVLLQKQGVLTGHYLHGTKGGLVVIEPR